jgi:hypothetical protein
MRDALPHTRERSDGSMIKCDGAWPGEQIERLRAWIADGAPA